MIRVKSMVGWATVLGVSAVLTAGCDSGANPKPVVVPPSAPVGDVNKPPPKDVKKGGGPGASGNMKRSPADST